MDNQQLLLYAASAVSGYLLGCISSAYIIGKLAKNSDIREHGSGNLGTSNMLRTYGWGLGAATLVGDALKGVLAVVLAGLFAGSTGSAIAGIAVVVGHNWPVFLKFKGGKGIATTLGVMLALTPYIALTLFGVTVILALITRMVSVGSIVSLVLLFPAVYMFHPGMTPLLVCTAVLIFLGILQHRANIARLIKGRENRISIAEKESESKTNRVQH